VTALGSTERDETDLPTLCNSAPMRGCRYLVILLAVLTIVFAGTATSGATVAARTAVTCTVPHGGEGLGPTYLLSLSVSGTSCGTGLSVVHAYHACQLKPGGLEARCTTAVHGFRCTENRGPSIPTEFYSTVKCKDPAARVDYKYSQFT